MRIFFFFLFAISYLSVFSQDEFAPIGAKWHLTITEYGSDNIGFSQLESIGDTIINNKACKIISREVTTCLVRPSKEFMYEEGGKLYFYNFSDSTFSLLIDFNANINQTWEIPLWVTGATLTIRVDSISYIEFQNDTLRVQHVSETIDGVNYYLNFGRKVIEKIGFSDGLFIDVSAYFPCDINYEGPLRCYEDSELGLISFVSHACDFVPIYDIIKEKNVSFYPNPTGSYLELLNLNSNTNNYFFEIFTIDGKRVSNFQVIGNKINIINLNKGLYFIKVYDENNLIGISKIIKT